MVDSGQSPIRSVSFESHTHPGIPVELFTRSDLFERVGPGFFDRPDRPSFDALMLVHAGEGTHTVDFERIPLRPGRLVRTRPGQLQTWDVVHEVDATMVLASVTTAAGQVWFPGHTAYCDLGTDTLNAATGIIELLQGEQTRFAGDESSIRLMTSLFDAYGALFDRAQASSVSRQLPEPYVAFRLAIEAGSWRSHNVRNYAVEVGFSERTISRACQRVTGLTAKGVLNQRLTLEAKRLLAHTDKPAATIAAELGFSEATNFHKFFGRHTSQRPIEFRSTTRQS